MAIRGRKSDLGGDAADSSYNHLSMSAVESIPGRYVVPSIPVRRFTVTEYARLIDDGFFAADEQFELLDGLITPKMSRNPPHDAVLNRIRRRLERSIRAGWMLRIQSALSIGESVPEPDIAIVRGDDADYASRHPNASDAPLIIEVANTSLTEDRTYKLQIYAKAGIGSYWVVNLIDQQIETFEKPVVHDTPRYLQQATFRIADLMVLPEHLWTESRIPVSDLLLAGGHEPVA